MCTLNIQNCLHFLKIWVIWILIIVYIFWNGIHWIFEIVYMLQKLCTLNVYVGSQFSDRAHYNEFVESGFKSWALMRRQLVLGVKNTQNQAAQGPREKGPLARGRESPTPIGHTGASFLSLGLHLPLSPPPFLGDLCCYIFPSSVHLPPTLVSHPCLS